MTNLSAVPSSLLAGRPFRVEPTEHDWVVVVSQDCDLDWDYAARYPRPDARPVKNKELPAVLLCEARSVPEGVRLPDFDKDIWRRVSQNQDERYHLLPAAEASADRMVVGFDELLVDFKRYFTVSTPELYQRLALRPGNPERAERRAEIETPFREDFCRRFANFQSRVALPDNYA